MIENVTSPIRRGGMVSLWLPFCFFCARSGDDSCAAGDEGGTFRWAANAMLRTCGDRRWWRRAGAEGLCGMKCLCFCYLAWSWR